MSGTITRIKMKAKLLIGDDDYAANPKGYFGQKIPWFFPCSGPYAEEHGSMNYGVFRATEYANRKASEVLDAVVTLFYGEDQELKDNAYEELKRIAETYRKSDT